ncbi:MAG: phosphoribosylglycinamide formyltransferase [Candidatus Schekmanbacteria bacterium]|nr:phosphoribosylglycinamide formyltransferase [Candidatus Schekmanbacteria bacterium]
MKNIGILVSGRGSNLQALIDSISKREINGTIAIVVSNIEDAQALNRAASAGIRTAVVDHRKFKSREDFEKELIRVLDDSKVDLVCLAGFMRVLTSFFIRNYRNRIINIHPALLPSFPGIHAQKQALDYGVKVSGCTVHFVDEGTDTGPIILQKTVPVYDADDEESLSERILAEEHKLYVEAVKLFCSDRIIVNGRKVFIKQDYEEDKTTR